MALTFTKNPWIMFLLGLLFAQFALPMFLGLFSSVRSGGSAGATKAGK